MKIRFSLTAILLAASVAGSPSNSHSQTTGPVAGRIVSLNCDARLQKNGAQTEAQLSSSRDIALGLFSGDRVQCTGAGYMEVLVFSGTKKITALEGWFSIPPLPPDPPYLNANAVIAQSLANYGRAGATRGNADDSRILWPSANCAVLPDRFVIRWTPVPQKISIAVMSESKDVTIWGPSEVDGAAGSLKSVPLSSALAAYKVKAGSPFLVLTLTLANSSDWEEVRFSLLNAQQEQELNAQLDYWEKHTQGLALRLGRGYSYSRFKLFADAAEEYESALSSAPGSRYLLEDAIEANRLAGRPSRAKELQTRLASQPEAENQLPASSHPRTVGGETEAIYRALPSNEGANVEIQYSM